MQTLATTKRNRTTTMTSDYYEENGIYYPKSESLHHPRVERFKRRRQRNQGLAAVTGGIVGGALLTPLGLTPVGIAVGGFVCHRITKTTGRVMQARLAQSLEQQEACRDEALHGATNESRDIVLSQ